MTYIKSLDTKEEFEIPLGETSIGRGPFLKVTEKKLSRNHAVIKKQFDGIFLKPIHKNPTFIHDVTGDVWTPLPKDEWKLLNRGDKISLLPDSLRFMVGEPDTKETMVREEEEEKKPVNNNQKKTIINNAVNEKDSEAAAAEEKQKIRLKSNESSNLTAEYHASYVDTTFNANPVKEKKRQLPSWMLESPSSESPAKKKTAPKKAPVRPTMKEKREAKVVEEPIEEEEEEEEEDFFPIKGRKRKSAPRVIEENDDEDDDNIVPSTNKKRPHSNSDGASPSKSSKHHQDEVKGSEKNVDADNEVDLLDELMGVCSSHQNKRSKQETPSDKADTTPSNKQKIRSEIGNPDQSVHKQDAKDFWEEDSASPTVGGSILNELMDSGKGTGKLRSKKDAGEWKKKEPVEDSDEEMKDDVDTMSSSQRKTMKLTDSISSTAPSDPTDEPSGLPICPYGSKCYRKNPVHFTEYSHSKSDDDDDDDDDDDRLECQFGTSCYRKNPQHWKEYKHTKDISASPARKGKPLSRNATKKGKSVLEDESDDDGEENTYDYNDSFLGDDGNDSEFDETDDSDSDYKPDDVDDEEDDDDVNDLVKEAKSFITNKKM